ncbi:MAG: peptide ABC transporter substrate-binding protein [Thermomicrobiales bacterium]
MKNGPFAQLCDSLKSGAIDRRQFIERATALGVGAGVAVFCANASVLASSGGRNGMAIYAGQDGTPAASPVAGAGKAPDAGTEGQTRGAGGELKMLQWQAITMLDAHRATGTKDFLASDIINEPLIRYLPDGSMLANLVTEVPSVEGGTLAKDLTSATFKLLPGVTWSDGTPFTAKDVKFTWQWVTTEANGAVDITAWQIIKDIEVVDDLTAKVTYKEPTATWFDPFAGGNNGHIIPSHVFNDDPTNANESFMTNPIGTGPYKLESLTPNDTAIFVANDKYREPNKPFFAKIQIKGGGDAASAARAVLETGDYDYAWNLQVEPKILEEMISPDGPGQLITEKGTSVERIHLNFSDPNKEVDGQRSQKDTPHPFFTDAHVREALNLAVPRDLIASQFYGPGQPATSNILTGLKAFDSPNTSWEFNLDKANKILDDAGWAKDGDVRKKDGVELSMTYATTINQVRQKTQAVVKQAFEALGCKVQLVQIDGGIFFDSSAGNDQNIGHFYWDIQMYTNNATSPVPISFMADWYAGPNGSNIAQKENGWQGTNRQRWVNADFDALYEKLQKVTDLETAFSLLIQMNDIIIGDRAVIPQVNRSADTYAISRKLRNENVALGVGFEYSYWNIANWNFVEGASA